MTRVQCGFAARPGVTGGFPRHRAANCLRLRILAYGERMLMLDEMKAAVEQPFDGYGMDDS
jgi:hypothetical protein